MAAKNKNISADELREMIEIERDTAKDELHHDTMLLIRKIHWRINRHKWVVENYLGNLSITVDVWWPKSGLGFSEPDRMETLLREHLKNEFHSIHVRISSWPFSLKITLGLKK